MAGSKKLAPTSVEGSHRAVNRETHNFFVNFHGKRPHGISTTDGVRVHSSQARLIPRAEMPLHLLRLFCTCQSCLSKTFSLPRWCNHPSFCPPFNEKKPEAIQKGGHSMKENQFTFGQFCLSILALAACFLLAAHIDYLSNSF